MLWLGESSGRASWAPSDATLPIRRTAPTAAARQAVRVCSELNALNARIIMTAPREDMDREARLVLVSSATVDPVPQRRWSPRAANRRRRRTVEGRHDEPDRPRRSVPERAWDSLWP